MKCLCLALLAVLLNSVLSFGMQYSFEAGVGGGVQSEHTLGRHATGIGSFYSSFRADPARNLIGPSFALTYKDRLGVQVDTLYKSFDIRTSSTGGTIGSDPRIRRIETLTHAKSWETSVLFRYIFTNARVRPYALGGVAFPKISGESETRTTVQFTGEEIGRSASRGPVSVDGQIAGLAMGGGAELKISRFRLVPEFRYIRRNDDQQNFTVVLPENQFEFLIGLRYQFGF